MLVTSIEQFNEAKDLLIAARSNLVNGAKKTGGLINDYATNLCVMFNKVDENGDVVLPWYELKGKAKAGLTTVVRTANDVVTFTTPSAASYSITADEVITVTVPKEAVALADTDIVAAPTITVTNGP